MQLELELVRKHLKDHSWPLRDEPPKNADRTELSNRRMMMRAEVDDLIKVGFVKGDIVAFSIRICRTTLAVAGTAAQFGTVPEFLHFSEAATELLQASQHRLDKALLTQDWHAVRVALAQMELILYGISVNFGMPYGTVLRILDEAYTAGHEVPRLAVADALRKAGLEVPREEGEAAND